MRQSQICATNRTVSSEIVKYVTQTYIHLTILAYRMILFDLVANLANGSEKSAKVGLHFFLCASALGM